MDCVCQSAGFCVRYGREVTPHIHNLCRTREDFRLVLADQAKKNGTLAATDEELEAIRSKPEVIAAIERDRRHDERLKDPCVYRSDKPVDTPPCKCVSKAKFNCSSPKRGGMVTLTDCGDCPVFE